MMCAEELVVIGVNSGLIAECERIWVVGFTVHRPIIDFTIPHLDI